MQHQESQWQSGDGLRLYAQSWQPDEPAQGLVCLVHGLGEHSGRYGHVAQAFTAAGFAVQAFDYRGHGRSAGQRGHIASYDAIMDDVGLLVTQGRERFPGLPCFLYGHSLGGNLVLNYALRRQPDLAGVVATSPGLKLAFKPSPVLLAVAKSMDRLWPAFSQSNGLELAGISRDPAVIQAYQSDPLVHDRVSARLGLAIIEKGQWAIDHAAELTLPALLVHGTADRLTSPQGSREFASRAPHSTLKLWEGLYHETHNEPEQAKVLAFTIAWIKSVLDSTGNTPWEPGSND